VTARGRVLLISGSTRAGSSNTMALRALHDLDHPGVKTDLYQDLSKMPVFVPDLAPVPAEVVDLLAQLSAADAVLFATPEYAGGLPGALKNLLDWTVGGGQLYGKLVAWLDVANPGRGAGARDQLRTVLGYVAARIVEPACVHINLDRNGGSASLGDGADRQLGQAVGRLTAAIQEDRHARGTES
jgi:chromate reductase